MRINKYLFALIFFSLTTERVHSYKGLFIMTLGTNSHLNYFKAIIQALARKGHDITFITSRDGKFEEKNVKQVLIPESAEDALGNLFNTSSVGLFLRAMEIMPNICINHLKTFLDYEKSKDVTEKYEFIMLSVICTECYFGYLYESQTPFIYAFPNVIMSPYGIRMGEPEFPSVYPNILTSLSYPMSFSERILNVMVESLYGAYVKYSTYRIEREARKQNLWKKETPSASEIETMASLVLINSFKTLEKPIKVTTPNVIYVGGIHIQQPKPLPEDLKKWCDGAGDAGFIFFSLGSAVKPQEMKPEHLQIILSVFRALPQRIVWKWGAKDMENLPSNVLLHPWLPQQDILAHPNIRLFISHGGLLSLQEAAYLGVPILGMPVFGDQRSNLATAELEGWARQLRWDELTENKLSVLIKETMHNSSLREEVQKRSDLKKDINYNPSEEAVFWTEYVVRHKGARHLQSPLATMPWYEIYNMDVWAFIIFSVFLIFVILFLIVKYFFKCLKRRLFKVKTE